MNFRSYLLAVTLGLLHATVMAQPNAGVSMGENALLKAEGLKRQFRPEEALPYLKEAESIFEKVHATTSLIRVYSLRGEIDPDLDTRSAYYEKALALLKTSNDRKDIAAVLPAYAEVKAEQGDLPAAEEMLKESIRLSKELGMERLQWQYGFLGAIQIQRKEMVDALQNELLAIRIGEQFSDTSSHMAETYNYAAIIYSKMGKLEESGYYVKKAIATGGHSQDPMLAVQFRSNLADVLIRQDKPEEALLDLKILQRTYGKDMRLEARLQMLSRFVRCYSVLNDSANAGEAAAELMRYSDSLKPDEYAQLIICTQLNRFLVWSGQFGKARRYVEKQRLIAIKFKIPEQRMQAYLYQSEIDSAAGDMASALHNYQSYTRLKDSSNSINIAGQLNQLHVEFETEKKEKELTLNHEALALKQKDLLTERQHVDLLTKQTQLQQEAGERQQQELLVKQQELLVKKQELLVKQKDIELLQKSNRLKGMELERAAFIRNVIIAGALGIGLMSALLYSRYRMKKRASEELALQREEIRQKNLSLQSLINDKDKLLAEKEWLVKEVHHRVKNNLQMVISLLNSQSAYLSSQDAVAAIKESQRRMHAISLIHQRLYEKDETTIDMPTYISDLVDYLKDSFDCSQVTFALDLDPLVLDVSRAVPVGLILNEAITNALKYAFPNGQTGYILVALKTRASEVELIIADDGIGLPEIDITSPKKSLGMSLLKGLTMQIGGTGEIIGEKGVEIIIRFSPVQLETHAAANT